MSKGRIRVRLKSYDHRVIDESCEKILEVALSSGAKIVGPVPLPTRKRLCRLFPVLIPIKILKNIFKF